MTIDITHLDAGTDKVKAARAALKAAADELNVLSSTAGSGAVGHDPAATPTAGSAGDYLRRAAQLGFEAEIVPLLHLRQFSTRTTSTGAGAVPGALTIGAGVITALATGTGGTNWANPRVLVFGDGTGASITATVAAGVITGYTVVAGGTGYTAPNTSVMIVDGPVVVVVGDSIFTEQPTPSNPGESQWDVLKRAIRLANPDKTITFLNRAVGSQTWTTFDGLANSNYPAWYSNTAKLWTDYIKECQPDLVVVAFGMNDRQNFTPVYLRNSLTTLAGFSPQPDVVLCTPLVPHASTGDPNLSSADSQEGRDQVAGYVRGAAFKNGYGLLDFNRQLRLVRDGYDVRSSALKVDFSATTKTLPYVSTSSGQGFAMEATFTGLTAGFWTGRQINVLISRKGANNHEFCRVEDNAGKLKVSVVEFWPGPVTTYVQVTEASNLTTPTSGSLVLQVLMKDTRLVVTANSVVIFDQIIARMAGLVPPELSVVPADVASVSMSQWIGEAARFNPRLNDLDLWGGAADPYRGNALNHPSSLAVRHVLQPVIEAAEWAASPMTMGDIPTTSNFVGWGIARPRARYHFVNRPMTTPTNPPADGGTLVVEDITTPGITMLSDQTGVARFYFGDDAAANRALMFYNHNNDEWGITINAVQQFRTSVTGGMLVGAPTGGYKGVGHVNVAGDIWKNNAAYTNPHYVFEWHYTGALVKYGRKPGAKAYAKRGRMSLKDLREYTRTHLHLPGITNKPLGMFGRADFALETLEEHALYLMDQDERMDKLEAQIAALLAGGKA